MPSDSNSPRAQISERARSPAELSFGWQRARLLGAFFNGVFLLALGISIFLQSIERFISIERESLWSIKALFSSNALQVSKTRDWS